MEPAPLAKLSPQELKVLLHLCNGSTNKEIAALMYLSPHTIKGHVERITRKLEVTGRTQALVRALQLGLVEVEVHQNTEDARDAIIKVRR